MKAYHWIGLSTLSAFILGWIMVFQTSVSFGSTQGGNTPLTPTPLAVQPQSINSITIPNQINTSSIDSPSPTCYNPVPGSGACYILWQYIYVSASSSQYMISTTVAINHHIQAYVAGFFQNYMYLPYDMLIPGFKVTCGYPGSGVSPNLGNSYSYEIKARDTGGAVSTNNGLVSCPSDIVKVMLPLITKP